MYNELTTLNTVRRPKLLIRAARAGTNDFIFSRDLPKISGANVNMSLSKLFELLFEREDDLNELRLQNDAIYDVRKHIRILTAMMVIAAHPTNLERAA